MLGAEVQEVRRGRVRGAVHECEACGGEQLGCLRGTPPDNRLLVGGFRQRPLFLLSHEEVDWEMGRASKYGTSGSMLNVEKIGEVEVTSANNGSYTE